MAAVRQPARVIAQDIQVYRVDAPRGRVRHALFDFDGTLSLIRAGWQEVMLAQCTRELARTRTGETEAQLRQVCRDFITRLTGRQTIYQMMQLAEEMQKRGAAPRPALEYKHEYLDLLQGKIGHRLEALRTGREPAARYLVPGCQRLLEGLRRRHVQLYLASGTDQPFVVEEAQLLGLAEFFGPHVYGAQEDYRTFSKKMVIDRILQENGLRGAELAVFGDGYVEIENAKQVGGVAVGAATVEEGEGTWDEWKRERLLQVGVDILVPHWGEADALLRYLVDGED